MILPSALAVAKRLLDLSKSESQTLETKSTSSNRLDLLKKRTSACGGSLLHGLECDLVAATKKS